MNLPSLTAKSTRQPFLWRKVHTLSAVIPTLNEFAEITETIRHLHKIPEIREIIVADGGSSDQTRTLAERLGCLVLNAPHGRGAQLRAGAEAASGDAIIMVHADTWLPSEAGAAVLTSLGKNHVVGGGFWKVFRNPHWLMRGSRARCAMRLFLAGRIMGDQAIFVRRDTLNAVGGIPDLPLMEEFELCRRLRQMGHLALANATVSTSARRFAKQGVLRTYFRMWRITFHYYLGTKPVVLRQMYEKN